MEKEKTGTREWSDVSLNAGTGCENQCLYCYARYNACQRWKRTTVEAHKVFVPNNKRIDANAKKESGVIMFPTQHDITPANIGQCMTLIRKNLDVGNKMLIVSKPHFECIRMMCLAYEQYKELIEFRFTIGSIQDDVLKFWEPNAPGFEERINCLKFANVSDFKTSVSSEPYLDAFPLHNYIACIEWITESFWIGKMNKIDQRCDFSGVSSEDYDKYVTPLKKIQSDSFVKSMYDIAKGYDKIEWKESVRKVIGSC